MVSNTKNRLSELLDALEREHMDCGYSAINDQAVWGQAELLVTAEDMHPNVASTLAGIEEAYLPEIAWAGWTDNELDLGPGGRYGYIVTGPINLKLKSGKEVTLKSTDWCYGVFSRLFVDNHEDKIVRWICEN